MQTRRILAGVIARVLIVTITLTPGAYATPIDTEAAVAADRERLLVLLDRPDVSAQLEAYGVKPADAKVRIAALTDAEVAQLAADMDDAPAGGSVLFFLAAYGVIVVLQLVAGVFGMVHLATKAVSAAIDLVASEARNHRNKKMPALVAAEPIGGSPSPDRDAVFIAPVLENLAAESAP